MGVPTDPTAVEDPAYPDLVTVACVNFAEVDPSTGAEGADRASVLEATKQARIDKMQRQVRDAARQGARLVVFPESVLGAVGLCRDCIPESGPCEVHRQLAEPVPGPSSRRLAELARETGTYIVFGIDEADPGDPRRIHNSAVLVGPEGLVGTYRKLHLGHPLETGRYTPGEELPVWDTDLGRIGILICYDFWSNPELSRILALKGARILVNPTRSADQPAKADYVRNTTVVRAQENLVYALSANWTGPNGDGVSVGTSTIAGPAFPAFNNVLATAGSAEQVLVTTLNFSQLGRWYDLFPWRSWRLDPERQLGVTELIASELSQLAESARSGGGRTQGR